MGLVSEQCLYNLASRFVEMEVIPACQAYGLGLLPWSPLIGGRLAGKKNESPRSKEVETVRWPTRFGESAEERVAQYLAYCDKIGAQPAHVALAWLLHRAGRHRPNHRPAHHRPVGGQPARAGDCPDRETSGGIG